MDTINEQFQRWANRMRWAPDQVPAEQACPECGERDVDQLVWDNDGTTVTCQTCGAEFEPTESGEG